MKLQRLFSASWSLQRKIYTQTSKTRKIRIIVEEGEMHADMMMPGLEDLE